MIRLNPRNLSRLFSDQLLREMFHVRSDFNDKLLPILYERLENTALRRDECGSIQLGSAITLFCWLKNYRHDL